MIPNYKQQSETESRRISTDGKLLLKTEPTSANERDSFANAELQIQADEEDGIGGEQEHQNVQYGPKPHIFSINYTVPTTSSMIAEHPIEQHVGAPSGSFQQTSKGMN